MKKPQLDSCGFLLPKDDIQTKMRPKTGRIHLFKGKILFGKLFCVKEHMGGRFAPQRVVFKAPAFAGSGNNAFFKAHDFIVADLDPKPAVRTAGLDFFIKQHKYHSQKPYTTLLYRKRRYFSTVFWRTPPDLIGEKRKAARKNSSAAAAIINAA